MDEANRKQIANGRLKQNHIFIYTKCKRNNIYNKKAATATADKKTTICHVENTLNIKKNKFKIKRQKILTTLISKSKKTHGYINIRRRKTSQ